MTTVILGPTVGAKLFTRKMDRVEFIRSSEDMWRNLIQNARINKNINVDWRECNLDKVIKNNKP